MRPASMPLGVILIGCLVATVMTLAFVPHRGHASTRTTPADLQRLHAPARHL